ncbi:MAG: AIPR family protein [Dehalococcoidia bacterium]
MPNDALPDSERLAFDEYLQELAETWYDSDPTKSFRHAAFQQIVPDPLADAQVIELTRIDRPGGDLEIDGWHSDEAGETILLFQSLGGEGKAPEGKVSKFWNSPDELLRPERVAALKNPALDELASEFLRHIEDGFNVRMVFASRAGYAPAAEAFADPKRRGDRTFELPDGRRITTQCTLELRDYESIARSFNEVRAGFRSTRSTVDLDLGPWEYEVAAQGERSLRATMKASEVIRVFRMEGMGFRLFSLNPRGPLANAKVNRNIANTLATPIGRRRFHLLNNGLCATCDDFTPLSDHKVRVENLQIVNGCQTTVT